VEIPYRGNPPFTITDMTGKVGDLIGIREHVFISIEKEELL
jgi:hypothetical protein